MYYTLMVKTQSDYMGKLKIIQGSENVGKDEVP